MKVILEIPGGNLTECYSDAENLAGARAIACSLTRKGKAITAIAEELGVSLASVHRYVKGGKS